MFCNIAVVRLPQLLGCMVVRLHCCVIIQICNRTLVQPPSCAVMQMYNYATAQLYDCPKR